jgi:hypothetical protein
MLEAALLMVFPNPFRAIGAFQRMVKAYFRGDALIVSGRTRAARRRICDRCDRRDGQTDQCKECSCFLALKLDLTTEKCPIDKWR